MSRLTDVEFNDLVTTGHQVLSVYPRIPGACVMMSALLAGRLHDLGHALASLVGGELAIGTTVIFGRSAVAGPFSQTDYDWDGHAWVRFGEYIADVSLVTTAYSGKAPQVLARHVTRLRKATQRLYVATPNAALCVDGLRFTPQHVFSREQIDALYRGAATHLPES